MDRNIRIRKLDSLSRCIRRIETKRPAALRELIDDVDLQDILSINPERAIQICMDAGIHFISELDVPPPRSMGEVFTILSLEGVLPRESEAPLRKAVGFRNLSVHAYEKVEWERVIEIVHERQEVFRQFGRFAINYGFKWKEEVEWFRGKG